MNNHQAHKLKTILQHNQRASNDNAQKVLVLVNSEQEIADVQRIVSSVSAKRMYDEYADFVGCSVPRAVYATTDIAVVQHCIAHGEYNYDGGAGLGRVVLQSV